MTVTDTDMVPCACGCGETVRRSTRSKDGRSWKRGHYLRDTAGKLTALPGPGDDLDDADDVDLGDALVPDFPPPPADDLDVPEWLREPPRRQDGDGEPEITADRPPGRLGQPRRAADRKQPPAAKTVRVTAALRKDVHAKIRFVLVPAGKMWEIRDPVCGGVFTQQEPEISDALAEIVCDSPDLLAWFTGPAGGFMKYFRLVMAVQPVGFMVWMHHIAHAQVVPAEGSGQVPPQMPAYAA